ncbi:MAG: Rne/Rng family ribonuclease [Alphaproteobacteria bacterium]|nr:Rne/Rng family ribonuclease [Alphaproteobacteria bacterium]
MPKRMLIDASHPEETRVVVLDSQKVEEFDFEAASRRPLKGNIYLAKVTRVEPSLQAAFVEYGGNRQGFLAFSEIHPDYYQIPVADREALLAEAEAEARRHAEDDFEPVETGTVNAANADTENDSADDDEVDGETAADAHDSAEEQPDANKTADETMFVPSMDAVADALAGDVSSIEQETASATESDAGAADSDSDAEAGDEQNAEPALHSDDPPAQALHAARPPQRWMRRRHYKIQEVIKRRQIILVQVVKEERGNKGAALTTYLSLAGRYCVLMPNTPRGGGISRKITNANDRKRLKSAAASLELPEGMGLIIRTAGESRTKLEIKRDYEYLLRMWDQIRELTLRSNAPACVYEEGDLIKRAIRDLYNKDVSEIVVEGDAGYRNAKDFMRMLMPSHAKNVKPYKDGVPLFQRFHTEAQLDAMFTPTVTLKSGGYIVINQTEALVAIDVNSGRATREHSIEDTAFKTNLEAADEIARQLRLRDLDGLIVIDFIDMEDNRNDRTVEKRVASAVKNDRARIQIGKISQFGLLEMSRQRLRAGVIAGSTVPCPHCDGLGIVRSVESATLRVLRAVEEEGQKQRASAISVTVPPDVAIYALNQKRRELARIESDYGMTISFAPDEDTHPGHFEIEKLTAKAPEERRLPVSVDAGFIDPAEAEEDEADDIETDESETVEKSESAPAEATNGEGGGRRRRRRRRRGGRDHDRPQTLQEPVPAHSLEFVEMPPGETEGVDEAEAGQDSDASQPSADGGQPDEGQGKRKRRRRRRGRRHHGEAAASEHSPADAESDTATAALEQSNGVAEEPAASLNAPSGPVWSLGTESEVAPASTPPAQETHEAVSGDEAPTREQVQPASVNGSGEHPAEAEATSAAPPAESEADTVVKAPPAEKTIEPPRKGWWQRRFS